MWWRRLVLAACGWLRSSGNSEEDPYCLFMIRPYRRPVSMAETSSRIGKTENPQVSHEQSDVNVRRILAFGLGLLVAGVVIQLGMWWLFEDRKSTRLNSSHTVISYAVFCLKKKKQKQIQ